MCWQGTHLFVFQCQRKVGALELELYINAILNGIFSADTSAVWLRC